MVSSYSGHHSNLTSDGEIFHTTAARQTFPSEHLYFVKWIVFGSTALEVIKSVKANQLHVRHCVSYSTVNLNTQYGWSKFQLLQVKLSCSLLLNVRSLCTDIVLWHISQHLCIISRQSATWLFSVVASHVQTDMAQHRAYGPARAPDTEVISCNDG